MLLGGSGSEYQSSPASWDCVYNCFDYLDNGVMNGYMRGSNSYYWKTVYNLGYDPSQNGGVRTSDISTIGGYGGLTVTDLGSGGFGISGSGTTIHGQRIMMIMGGVGGANHAVVVTGTQTNGSNATDILYYDPTTGLSGVTSAANYSGFYAVSR